MEWGCGGSSREAENPVASAYTRGEDRLVTRGDNFLETLRRPSQVYTDMI